ncbi:MAG: hypothetical protein PHR92_00535 [Lachnospiraceae bacterium]|nr:hypothetical protein [Lachnospiraceae bacterium]
MKMNKAKLRQCGINYDQGMLYFAGDEALYLEYLEKMLHYDFCTDMREKLSAENPEESIYAADRYKALANYICAPEIVNAVSSIRIALKAGKPDRVEEKLARIGGELDKMRSIMGVTEISTEVEGIDF